MPNASFLPAPLLLLTLAASPAAQDAGPSFGHARTRELAELGRLPTTHDVVVRDIVNYHRHRLPLPKADHDVALEVRFDRGAAGFEDTVLLQVGYTTRSEADRAFVQPVSIALVVDCSGSMRERGKMDQVKRGLCAFVQKLRDDDEVELITFANEARVAAERRAVGRDRRWLLCAIDALQPDSGTNLHAGLMLGLRELKDGSRDADTSRSRRVVLLTDGIANQGVTEPARILDDARPFTDASIDISTIGVGENLDVNLLEKLARGTRGLFHFVADEQDVQKVFVQEADSLLSPVARRPHLRITLPRGLTASRIFHEGVRRQGSYLLVDLPDFNAGVTGVVIVECRVDRDTRDEGRQTVCAELTFDSARPGSTDEERASADLASDDSVYTVQKGDSLEDIARRQLGDRALASHIARLNPELDERMLRIGQRIRLPGRGQVDVEVRKNAAIAVLAMGLSDMAEASESKHWTEADRALRRAQDEARQLFPGDDQDLQRVRDMTAGHLRTLQRYVDRFRDY
jgi:Mg-chelatase subunit ChlD